MGASKQYIHITENISNQEVQLKFEKTGKTTAKNLKITTKNNDKIQSKRTQQSDCVKTIAGNKQRLWKAARKKLWAHRKISDVYYFNQFVEPAYSTDGEQNARCPSKKQCQKVLKQMPQLM